MNYLQQLPKPRMLFLLRFPFLCLAILLCLTVSGQSEVIDKVVAEVNSDVITQSEVDEAGRLTFQEITKQVPAHQVNDALRKAREETLDALIHKTLIAQKAAEKNLTVSDKSIEAAFQQLLVRNNLTMDEFIAQGNTTGMSTEAFINFYKEKLRGHLLQNKIVSYEVRSNIIITDGEIIDYYDEHYTEQVGAGGYYLLQMGFAWGKDPADSASAPAMYASKMEAKKLAERVRNLVLKGNDFREMAKQFSDLPSAADGGDLGEFKEDEMAAYMRDAVVQLSPGEVSEIVETPAGFQFFKLLSGKDGQIVTKAPFESVKDHIQNILYNKKLEQEFHKWLKQARSQAYIKKL